jgi:hypothetical protein
LGHTSLPPKNTSGPVRPIVVSHVATHIHRSASVPNAFKLACQLLEYSPFDTGGFHGPRLRQPIMPHSNEFFSFSKRHYDGSSLPTFDLPGLVCGAIRVDRKWAQSVQVVKITLKGELKHLFPSGYAAASYMFSGILQTSVTFGLSSTGLAQMRCLEQTVRRSLRRPAMDYS